jgi:anti-sigma factor RsiW
MDHELVAPYALNALDGDERRAFEAHLASCERCRSELASLLETVAALGVAAAGPPPPPDLRGRILEATREERVVVVPLRRREWPVRAALGVAAAAALVLALWSVSLRSDLDATRERLAVLADPAARSSPLEGATGRLVVAADGRAALVVSGLAAPPEGRTYELWVIADGVPRPAGLFEPEGASTIVEVGERVPPGATVGP